MKLHTITGLPRSGSTLLANILNQNPEFHASSTSPICQIVNQISHTLSNSPEVKSELVADRKKTEIRVVNALRSFMKGWYECEKEKVVIDKSRGWASNHLMLRQLFPEAKMLVCVRDLRNIFSSVEKQHRNFPLLDTANTPQEKLIYNRADEMFSPQGIIGMPINGVEDLLRREPDNAVIIQYEQLTKSPQLVMERIYAQLGEKYFDHDFTNVEKTATDLDALYLNKFPHEGKGKVQPTDPDEWKQYVSPDVANLIMNKFQGYNQAFGYK